METILALDLGTTGVKAALMDREGRIHRHEYREYPVRVMGDRVEQDPETWWTAAVQAVSSLEPSRNDIAAVVLSGQMQDLIPLTGENDSTLAILYSDTRAQEEAAFVEGLIGKAVLERTTGNTQDASSLLAKLIWLREREPTEYRTVWKVLFGAHDYISWKLTSATSSDLTTLSTTGLLDLDRNEYAYSILDRLGIAHDIMPAIVRAGDIDGVVSSEASTLTGIKAGTPVFHGSGDVGSTTLGAGAGLPGSVSCYLGTSGWIASTALSVSDGSAGSDGRADPSTGIYNLRHPDPSRMIRVGPMLTAAGNVDWAVDAILGGSSGSDKFAAFDRAVSEAVSGNLIYLPYLAGERAPFKDPDARGAFIGIGRSTTKGELCRAILEGVAFALRSIHEAGGVPSIGKDGSGHFSLSGGGAKSPYWPQIIADVFGREVVVPKDPEMAGIRGAYMIAAKELDWTSDFALSENSLDITAHFVPIDRNTVAYQKKYAIFRGLYPSLRSSFSALARLKTENPERRESR
jgi:xylulokinase